jgi:hypothetical protein
MTQPNIKSLLAHSSKTPAYIAVDSDGKVTVVDESGSKFVVGVDVGTDVLGRVANQLRDETGLDGEVRFLKGITTEGDGGAGSFQWSDEPATDDLGTALNDGGLGTTEAGWRRIFSGPIDVKWYGAKGDGQRDFTVDLSSGNSTVTLTAFNEDDIGKLFTLRGAGAGGFELYGTITNVVGTTATLSVAASTTVTNAEFCWATDDTAAITRAFTAVSSAGLSTGVVLFPRGIYGHTGLTFPQSARLQGQRTKALNTVSGSTHLRLMAPAAQAYDVGMVSSVVEDMVLDGGRLTEKVLKLRYLCADSTFRRLGIMGAKLVAESSTAALVYIAPDGAPFNEVDICNFERCFVAQNIEFFGPDDYCRFAFNIDNNSNAFNLNFEHGYVSNTQIHFHYAAGSMNVRHSQLFRWVNACFYIESACQPFVIEDVYNEESSIGPFLQVAFNAGVKSSKPITLREVDIQTDILTACTQHLVLENVWTSGNIDVAPVAQWGQYGVTARNVVFLLAGHTFTGAGRETRVDHENTVFDPYGVNVQNSRKRTVAAPYDNSRDNPNTAIVQGGAGPTCTVTGQPADGLRGLVKIMAGGARGVATYGYSFDGGLTWEEDSENTPIVTSASDGLGASGLTFNFGTGSNYTFGDSYSWVSGLGGEFGRIYYLASLTDDRVFPLIAATLPGEELELSVVGTSHGFTATIEYDGNTLVALDTVGVNPTWARLVWDTSLGWILFASGL